MSVTAIVGANWGDEGKGKMTDLMAAESDYVVRFQGGSNAGHTINNGFGRFVLRLLPSGVFYRDVVNVLAPGVALNMGQFLKEREELMAGGVPEPRLCISDRAQVVMPYHILLDQYEEERLQGRAFGSTKAGIAPFYGDKYLKLGIQVADLFHEQRFRERIAADLEIKNILFEHLYSKPALGEADIDRMVADLMREADQIAPFVCDTTAMLQGALKQGKRILLEGQLGTLRDPDHGIYPFSTSSSPLAGFGAVGAGIPPHAITRIIAVAKAYSSCVGAGPFVSEIFGPDAEELRRRGGDRGEYGATTGRPRRMGWFDAVATRYGCRIQGATEAALSLLDVLSYLDEMPICTAYEIDGEPTEDFPVTAKIGGARPVLEVMPGWKCDISGARRFEDLPLKAQRYVLRVEELIKTPVRFISNGPDRNAVIGTEEGVSERA